MRENSRMENLMAKESSEMISWLMKVILVEDNQQDRLQLLTHQGKSLEVFLAKESREEEF